MEILGLETAVTPMKTSLEWLSSRSELVKGRISNLDNGRTETMQCKEQKENSNRAPER